ncbi:MAG: universal stress protein [Microvirga sp.]|nr:universal stress protein [Microvirga sp.]
MYKTILAPVDLVDTEAASPALERAVALAALNGGSVRLIYIRSIMPVTYMEFVPPSFDEEQQREAEEGLSRIAAGLDLPEERVSSVVRLGSIYHEVLDEADKCAADLIVVGSHRPSMSTYLLGSNATTIVRHARISVLVVR